MPWYPDSNIQNDATYLAPQVNELSSRADDMELQTKDQAVNVSSFGAKADYYLPNGSVNPSPTDNLVAFQAAFASSRVVKLATGTYYLSASLALPKDPIIHGNNCKLIFNGDGLNLGSHVWNRLKFFNLEVENIGWKKTGKGIFSDNGYIVYPIMDNVFVRGFEKAYSFISQSTDSNLTWGDLDLRAENCKIGFYLKGGWSNAVKIRNLVLNYIDEQGVYIESNQIHNFIIERLVMEQVGTSLPQKSSPFYFKNSSNGEMIIKTLYAEANGYRRTPLAAEINTFKTTGTVIVGFSYDAKSWLLNGEVYSEDTNKVTPYDLEGQGIFEFDTCSATLRCTVKDAFISTNMLGIASFTNSPVKFSLENIHLYNDGFSFPNMRYMFTNTTPATPVTVKTKNLTNDGGGAAFKYGNGIIVEGDLFSLEERGQYAMFKMPNNLTLTTGANVDAPYGVKTQGNLGVVADTLDNTKLVIPSSGLYMFSLSFVFSGALTVNGVSVSFYAAALNKAGNHFTHKAPGELENLNGMLYLSAGDKVSIRFKSLETGSISVIGSTNNVNFLLIKKL